MPALGESERIWVDLDRIWRNYTYVQGVYIICVCLYSCVYSQVAGNADLTVLGNGRRAERTVASSDFSYNALHKLNIRFFLLAIPANRCHEVSPESTIFQWLSKQIQ